MAVLPGRSSRRNEGPGFSEWQWLRILSSPSSFRLTTGDCTIPLAVPVFDDVPLVGRLFDPNPNRRAGPDLSRHAKLFGWDDAKHLAVRTAIGRFGSSLATAEQDLVKIDSSVAGKLRFDFSAADARRSELAAGLPEELRNVLGARDAERFILLVGIEALGHPSQPLEFDISVEGEFASLHRPGEREFIFPLTVASDTDINPAKMIDKRIAHLNDLIDWESVLAGAEAREK